MSRRRIQQFSHRSLCKPTSLFGFSNFGSITVLLHLQQYLRKSKNVTNADCSCSCPACPYSPMTQDTTICACTCSNTCVQVYFYPNAQCICTCVPPTCACNENFNAANCLCVLKTNPCPAVPGVVYDCSFPGWVAPSRPSTVYSCYVFDMITCTWIEPDCSQLIVVYYLFNSSTPKCLCGIYIEHCLNYALAAPGTTPPSYCLTCTFEYKLIALENRCAPDETLTISLFFGQSVTSLGVFHGHLVMHNSIHLI